MACPLALVFGPAPAPARGDGLDDLRRLEEEGDGLRARAEPPYRKALDAARMSGRFADRSGDSAAERRALRLEAGLLVNLLDARGFQALRDRPRAESRADSHADEAKVEILPADPLPSTVRPAEGPAAGGASPSEEDLRALASFLGEAGRAYFRMAEKEARDLPLLFESLALVERLAGDLYQSRADILYRGALARAEAAGAAGRAAAFRLRYQLRDFAGARAALAGGTIDPSALPGEEQVRFLRAGSSLARFDGQRAEALALDERLAQLVGKAEEVPLPAASLRTFLAGSTGDLQRAARTLLAAGASRILAARELTVTEFLAGQCLLEAGDAAEGAAVLERALARAEVLEHDPWLRATLRARLGEARERGGDHEGAAAAYERALRDLAPLAGVERYRARVAIDLAASLFGLEQLPDARRAALEALGMKDLPADLRVRARLLLAGIIYRASLDSDSGLDDALLALEAAERDREGVKSEAARAELAALIRAQRGNVERRRAILLESRGDGASEKARAAREAAVRCAIEARAAAHGAVGLERLEASAAANLAELLIEGGRAAEGRRAAGEALELARRTRAFETEWRAHWYLARAAIQGGEGAAAEGELEEAARIVEDHRGRILDQDRKSGFMVSKVGLYESMVRLALDRGESGGPRAFLAAERSRARSFVESLGLRALLLAPGRDQRLYQEYLSLLSRAEEEARGGGSLFGIRSAGSYENLRRQLDGLRAEARQTPGLSPFLRATVGGEAADVEGVQRGLFPGERLLAYFGAGDSLAAFVIGRGSFRAIRLPAARRDVERAARSFAEGMASDAGLGASLGESLLDPLLSALASGPDAPAVGPGGSPGSSPGSSIERGLVIVPFGELHRIPFEALRTRGKYLIETWTVSYLPSASALRYFEAGPEGESRGETERPRRFLALVDPDTDYRGDGRPLMPPLAGARAEVEAIAPLFPEREVLEGAAATKEACVRLSAGREIIHLACHGEFYPSRPLDSRLYLGGRAPQDGVLRACEIYGLDLRSSRLVALSGCETGRSGIGAGEDPVGIGVAFLQTGAKALLASLWPVEDRATAALMKTFYGKWLARAGTSRTSALREAKLAMLEGSAGFEPRHWASFVLIGPR